MDMEVVAAVAAGHAILAPRVGTRLLIIAQAQSLGLGILDNESHYFNGGAWHAAAPPYL